VLDGFVTPAGGGCKFPDFSAGDGCAIAPFAAKSKSEAMPHVKILTIFSL
jgi:hypothetical protein